MASDGKPVVFHLMKEVTSKKPEKSTKVGLFGTEKWSDVLTMLKFDFGTTSELFLFDQNTRLSMKFKPAHLQETYYVTKRAYLTPGGKPSKHAYMYRPTGPDIKAGDIVSLNGEEGRFCVVEGKASNPQVKVKATLPACASYSSIVTVSRLTFVERGEPDEDEANERDPILNLNEEFRSLAMAPSSWLRPLWLPNNGIP